VNIPPLCGVLRHRKRARCKSGSDMRVGMQAATIKTDYDVLTEALQVTHIYSELLAESETMIKDRD